MPANNFRQPESAFTHELALRYAQLGYRVQVEPQREAIPFDLRGYHPDLLAEKDDEHLIIEVKSARRAVPIEQFQQIIHVVRQHPGWRFLLVTPDRPDPIQRLPRTTELLSWASVQERTNRARRLLADGDAEAAFLVSWAALETLLRRHAEAVALPLDQLGDLSLLKQLYSLGEISIPQYDFALEALDLRNELAHGFQPTQSVAPVAQQLIALLNDLLTEWSAEASQAT